MTRRQVSRETDVDHGGQGQSYRDGKAEARIQTDKDTLGQRERETDRKVHRERDRTVTETDRKRHTQRKGEKQRDREKGKREQARE